MCWRVMPSVLGGDAQCTGRGVAGEELFVSLVVLFLWPGWCRIALTGIVGLACGLSAAGFGRRGVVLCLRLVVSESALGRIANALTRRRVGTSRREGAGARGGMSTSCKGLIAKYAECMRNSDCMKVRRVGLGGGLARAPVAADAKSNCHQVPGP